MNKVNFYFEIGIVIAVFVSSFLILTIEKDWWGGYLTSEPEKTFWHDYRKIQQHPDYIIENTVRLVILGICISFFMVIILLELTQSIFTLYYLIFRKGKEGFYKLMSKFTFAPGFTPLVTMSNQQIAYKSQLVVSNVQMFVVLATSVAMGYCFGVIQGYMDPESHRSVYVIMNRFSRELELSQVFGMYIGAASAFIIEGLR